MQWNPGWKAVDKEKFYNRHHCSQFAKTIYIYIYIRKNKNEMNEKKKGNKCIGTPSKCTGTPYAKRDSG